MLSVPTGDRYPDFTMDEEQQKAHVLPLLLEHFETLQKSGPVLALVEDVHWADPSTQEFLDLLVDGVEPWRLLVLITSRPEFTAPWVGNAQVSLMALNRLSRRHSRRLVKEAAGAYGLSAEMEKEIVARTDGVPLFIEELTETVVSTSDTAGAGLASTAAIPSTLQDSLMARFDSLAAGKIVAQTGAAIGREFSHELIKVVWERDQTELERGLDEVVSSGVIFRRGAAPSTIYIFKHALLQDAAYASLLRAHRKSLHQRIAEVLTSQAPEHPAVLAYHWEGAEQFENALRSRLEATNQSRKKFALLEANLHCQASLDLLERLPETDTFDRYHLDTVVWGIRFESIGREHFLRHSDRAIKTAAHLGEISSLVRIKAYKGSTLEDEDLLSQAAKDAETIEDKEAQAQVSSIYASYLGMRGRFEDSYRHTAKAIETYGELGEIVRQGYSMASEGSCYTARSGRFDDSLDYARRARIIAESTGDRGLQAWLGMEAELHLYQGLWEECVTVAERYLPTAYETQSLYIALWISAWAAIGYVKLGRLDDAERLLQRGWDEADPHFEYNPPKVYFRAAASALQVARGDTASAVRNGQDAVEFAGNLLLEQGVAFRALGQALQASASRLEADEHYRRSIEALSKIQSKPEFAQSLLAYGSFKHEEDAAEGKRLINEALSIFREIGASGWITEAQGVLE